jgi:hypothetical protein
MRIQDSEESPPPDDKEEEAPEEEDVFLGMAASSLWSILIKAASFGTEVRFDATNADTGITFIQMLDQSPSMGKNRSFVKSPSRQLTSSPHSSKSMRRGNFGEVGSMIIRSASPTGLPRRSNSIAKRIETKQGSARRGCKVNREGLPLLLPMRYDEAVMAIQSHYRVHFTSTKYKKLMSNIRDKIRGKDAWGEEKKAIALTDDDREAARIAMERLASARANDAPSSLRSSLEHYFEHSPLLCPGVAAVETLFDVLSSPLALSNFLAFSETSTLRLSSSLLC